MIERRVTIQPATTSLVVILDRVLDKGLVVAGDIRVSLANVELLTIRVRLLVRSIDKAKEIGLDWWRQDSFFSSQAVEDAASVAGLRAREALEQQLTSRELARPSRQSGRAARQRQPETER